MKKFKALIYRKRKKRDTVFYFKKKSLFEAAIRANELGVIKWLIQV